MRSRIIVLVIVAVAAFGATPAASTAANGVFYSTNWVGGPQKGNLDGSGSLTTMFPGTTSYYGVAFSADKLAYTEGADFNSQRLTIGNLDGTGTPTQFTPPGGMTNVTGITYDARTDRFLVRMRKVVSTTETTTIYAYETDGTNPVEIYTVDVTPAPAANSTDIAAATEVVGGATITRIYWCTYAGTVYRADWTGVGSVSNVTTLYTFQQSCNGVAVDPSTNTLFFARALGTTGNDATKGIVVKGSTQGSAVAGSPTYMYRDQNSPSGLSIDTSTSPNTLYWANGDGIYRGSVSGGTPVLVESVLNSNAVVVRPATTAPSNSAPPTISGTSQAGGTLTASPGTWNGYPVPTVAYQWQRCDETGSACVDIAGATSLTHALVCDDAGKTFRFKETGSNSAGSADAFSGTSGVVPTCSSPAPSTPEAGPQAPSPGTSAATPARSDTATLRSTTTLGFRTIATTIRVPGAGRLRQVGVHRAGKRATPVCTATRAVVRAGSVRILCDLDDRTARLQYARPVRVTLTTTYTATGGTAQVFTRVVTLKRLPMPNPEPVTG